ncbi:FecR family protein [uncultured Treponema sp.]|uniref:FecR family protein n=1 Tax=uncultured Treponema sp. TaxID=162155 RepID=UPI0025EBCD05|nr:FecR family protein [uncultured Treponema sp.]
MKKTVKTFAFICLTLFGSVCAFSAPFEATVVSAKGKTEVQRAGIWTALKTGNSVSRGDVIQTGFKSELIIKIKNSTVTVSPMSRITVEQLAEKKDKDETKLFLDTGSLRSNVKKTEDRRIGFTVRSPVATASVRGTEFSVKNIYGGTEIIGYEGETTAWKSYQPQQPEIAATEDDDIEIEENNSESISRGQSGAVIVRKHTKSSYTENSSTSPKENLKKMSENIGKLESYDPTNQNSSKRSNLLINITIKE